MKLVGRYSLGTSAKILSNGTDRRLLWSRHLVLETGGYKVHSLNSEVLLSCSSLAPFDLALLCHTLPPVERPNILCALRRLQPGARILSLDGPVTQLLSHSEDVPTAPSRPEALLLRIDGLMHGLQSKIHSTTAFPAA
jgi:hypothetical protein